MSRRTVFIALAVLLISSLASASSPIPGCTEQTGPDTNGSIYLVCPPSNPNADLLIFAHGFVDPTVPVSIPYDQLVLPDGTSVPGIVMQLGMGFVAPSYPTNGLAITQGVADVKNVVAYYKNHVGTPRRVYLTGVSEGGLVTAKAIETAPNLFTGGLAACGPIGDFNYQVSYLGDGRVLFDYFFPGVIPGTAINVPDEVGLDFNTCTTAGCTTPYVTKIRAALDASPSNRSQLANVAHIPLGPDPDQSIIDVLRYNAVETTDAATKLGGNPFDNPNRFYFGSSNDLLLNLKVERYNADPAALQSIAAGYQTTGNLTIPLVTLHTTGDNQVPFLHELVYLGKVSSQGKLNNFVPLPVSAYGHCNFTAEQAVIGLIILELKTPVQ